MLGGASWASAVGSGGWWREESAGQQGKVALAQCPRGRHDIAPDSQPRSPPPPPQPPRPLLNRWPHPAVAAQLVSGLVRPHKPEAGEATPLPRRVFEVTHKSMGYAALLVSWLAIMSGIEHASTLGLIDGKVGPPPVPPVSARAARAARVSPCQPVPPVPPVSARAARALMLPHPSEAPPPFRGGH